MSYEDYLRNWKVIPPGAAECASDSIVTFGGPPDMVTVRCNGESPYRNGRYKEDDTIEGDNYVIRIIEGTSKRRIMFDPKGGVA